MEIELQLTQCQAAKLAGMSREKGEAPGLLALSFLARGVRHPSAKKNRRSSFLRRGVSATHKTPSSEGV